MTSRQQPSAGWASESPFPGERNMSSGISHASARSAIRFLHVRAADFYPTCVASRPALAEKARISGEPP